MDFKIVMDLMFREVRIFFKDYEEDIAPPHEGYIQEFSKSEKSVKIIFDQVNFKILNISENVETLSGHTSESLRNKSILAFLGFVALDHVMFLQVWLKWANQICGKYDDLPFDPVTTLCGVKLKHKDGRMMRAMIRQSGLEFLENGGLKVSVITVDDVSHLLKSDFYWGRTEFGRSTRYVHSLVSTDKKDAKDKKFN